MTFATQCSFPPPLLQGVCYGLAGGDQEGKGGGGKVLMSEETEEYFSVIYKI